MPVVLAMLLSVVFPMPACMTGGFALIAAVRAASGATFVGAVMMSEPPALVTAAPFAFGVSMAVMSTSGMFAFAVPAFVTAEPSAFGMGRVCKFRMFLFQIHEDFYQKFAKLLLFRVG